METCNGIDEILTILEDIDDVQESCQDSTEDGEGAGANVFVSAPSASDAGPLVQRLLGAYPPCSQDNHVRVGNDVTLMLESRSTPVTLDRLLVDFEVPDVTDMQALPKPSKSPTLSSYSVSPAASTLLICTTVASNELAEVARDPVWRDLTKQCGHAHRRQMPVEWNLLRIRMMAVGSLRLSLLPSTAPGDHGLEMPTTGSDEVDAETGMFRTEDELAAFHRKMADMKMMLEEELEELHEQELGVYAQHVEDDFLAKKIFEEMQSVLREEMKELHHQERIIELEVNEQINHPDPVICRPRIDSADDEHSRRIREEGLKFISSDNKEVSLRYDNMAPELDLSAVLNDPTPFVIQKPTPPSTSSTPPDRQTIPNGDGAEEFSSPSASSPIQTSTASPVFKHKHSSGSRSHSKASSRKKSRQSLRKMPTMPMATAGTSPSSMTSQGSLSASSPTFSCSPTPSASRSGVDGNFVTSDNSLSGSSQPSTPKARKRVPLHPSLSVGTQVMKTSKRGLL